MRICILGDASSPHIKKWVNYFVTRGAETHLLSLEPSIGTNGIEHIFHSRIRPRWVKYPLSSFSFAREIEKIKPDLINAHFVPNYGLISALISFRPLVISCWGSDVLDIRSRLHLARVKFALRKADLITTDGEVLVNAVTQLGIPGERILNVPIGVNAELFKMSGAKSLPPKVVNLRRLAQIYNPEHFIYAIPSVLSEEKVQPIMLSEGSQKDRVRIEKLVKKLGIEKEIKFVPFLSQIELAKLLCESTIYVSSSRVDSTSVTLLEAMACGAFPVVADIPGNREWIKDGENGYLVPLNDSKYLANCIVSALKNPELMKVAGARNREIVRTYGLFEKNMKLIEDAFIKLIR